MPREATGGLRQGSEGAACNRATGHSRGPAVQFVMTLLMLSSATGPRRLRRVGKEDRHAMIEGVLPLAPGG